MSKAVICMGDSTSHGGKVLEGLPNATIHGKPVAARGHKVFCPLCRGTFPISEGVPFHTFAGKNTAVDGMRTACGATLIASQRNVVIEYGGSAGEAVGSENQPNSENSSEQPPVQDLFDQHFEIVDKDGRPLRDIPYILHLGSGSGVRGRTCEEGRTFRLERDTPLELSIIVLEDVTPIDPHWDR